MSKVTSTSPPAGAADSDKSKLAENLESAPFAFAWKTGWSPRSD